MAQSLTTGIAAHITVIDGQPTTTTQDIAEVYGKQHKDVLEIVRKRMAEAGEWGMRNFTHTPYTNPQNGQTYPVIRMTKKGFHFVVGKFTGAKAVAHQIAFADAFERMEGQIAEIAGLRNSAIAASPPQLPHSEPATRYNPATPRSSHLGQQLQNTVAGICSPEQQAAQSRNTAQVCGFFVRAPSFGGSDGRSQGLPVQGLRLLPGLQTRSSCLPRFAAGVAVVLRSNWRPTMVETLTSLCAIALVLSVVDGKPTTTSLDIARHFGRRHDHVMDTIRALIAQLPADYLPNFREIETDRPSQLNGAPVKSPAYRITRDGFTLLAMGFTGKKALQFKLAYIDAFNKMEAQLSQPATPAQLPHSEPGIDVRALLLGGQTAEPVVAIPPAIEQAINKQAWALAHDAYELLRQHMVKRMHYSHVKGYPVKALDTRSALADIKSITLGAALAHTAHRELEYALGGVSLALHGAQDAQKRLLAQMAALTQHHTGDTLPP